MNGTTKIEKEDSTEETSVVLVDDDYAKIIYLGFAEESNMGPTLKLYVENKSDKTFIILTDQFYVDDKQMESLISCDCVVSSKKPPLYISSITNTRLNINNFTHRLHII